MSMEIHSNRSSLRATALRLAVIVYLAWLLLAFVYPTYGFATYSGLYRFLAEWHMQGTGRYSPNGTWIEAIFLLAAPPIALILLALKLRWIGEAPALPGPAPEAAAPAPVPVAAAAHDLRRWTRIGAGILSMLTVVSLGSSWLAYDEAQHPQLYETLNLADRHPPATSQVELQGQARREFIVAFREGNAHSTFVPVTAPDWHRGQPIVYVVRLPYDAEPDSLSASLSLRGILHRNDLPGAVAALFEKNGVTLAPTTYVLDTAGSSSDLYIAIAIATGAQPFLALFFALIVGIGRAAEKIRSARRRPRLG